MPDANPAHLPEQPAIRSQLALSQDRERRPALPLRNDTMLGVCEGLGEEFGFNPNYLRLAFAGCFYWNPVATVGAYLALGLALALARWLCPAAPVEARVWSPEAPAAANEADPLSLAA